MTPRVKKKTTNAVLSCCFSAFSKCVCVCVFITCAQMCLSVEHFLEINELMERFVGTRYSLGDPNGLLIHGRCSALKLTVIVVG